jgi:tRNA threonylcarbamoyladenosine biosynthesis protein TsaE
LTALDSPGRAARVAVTRSEEETLRLAESLARGFSGREVVLLLGELGAGKTVFARGLAAGLDVQGTASVCSPSYCLVNVYQGRCPVFHIDLYRLQGEAEIRDLGWEDYLGEGVVIVEWAEKLPFVLDGIRVTITAGAGDERRIEIWD